MQTDTRTHAPEPSLSLSLSLSLLLSATWILGIDLSRKQGLLTAIHPEPHLTTLQMPTMTTSWKQESQPFAFDNCSSQKLLAGAPALFFPPHPLNLGCGYGNYITIDFFPPCQSLPACSHCLSD